MTAADIEQIAIMVRDCIAEMRSSGGAPEVFLAHPDTVQYLVAHPDVMAEMFAGHVDEIQIAVDFDLPPRRALILSKDKYRQWLLHERPLIEVASIIDPRVDPNGYMRQLYDFLGMGPWRDDWLHGDAA